MQLPRLKRLTPGRSAASAFEAVNAPFPKCHDNGIFRNFQDQLAMFDVKPVVIS